MKRHTPRAAAAATLVFLALVATACSPVETEVAPTLEPYTPAATEPDETSESAADKPDRRLSLDAEDQCRTALTGQYGRGLSVSGDTIWADKTASELYPDETPDSLREAGIDPDQKLLLVTLTGHPSGGGEPETISCYVYGDGSAVANIETAGN